MGTNYLDENPWYGIEECSGTDVETNEEKQALHENYMHWKKYANDVQGI